jgi:NarL family two-component system response regulator LiaR
MMDKIKVLIVDDHPLFREGLCQLLLKEKDLDCVAIAGNGEEAVKLASKFVPDIALIDVAMPDMNGVETAKKIKKECPATKVLMLSAFKYHYQVLACIQAGVDGYLLKNTRRRELVNAIRMVYAGDKVFSDEATGNILRGITDGNKGKVYIGDLNPRELEVFKLAAMGKSNKDIAHELGISVHTVATHLFRIFAKMGVQSRTEATLFALQEGWFTVNDLKATK